MLKSLKSTLKHSLIYGFGNFSSKLIGLILLPLFTSLLTTEEYGILSILEISSQILTTVFSLNLYNAMLRFASVEKSEREEKTVVFTALIGLLTMGVLVSVAFIPFSGTFSEIFFDNLKFSEYFTILSLTSSFGIVNFLPLTLFRLKERSGLYSIFSTGRFTIVLLLDIYFLVYLHMGVKGIILSQLIGQAAFLFFSLPFTLKHIFPKINFQLLWEMIAFGVPLVFSSLAGLVLTMSDRYVIKFIKGDASVGLYSLGFKIAGIINVFIVQSFHLSYVPIAFKKLKEEGNKRFYSKTLTYYVFVLVLSALFISVFGRGIVHLLARSKSYWDAFYVVPIISFVFIFKGMQYIISLGFQYVKKNSYNVLVVSISAVINLALNILFVKYWDFLGAAVATLISFFIMTLLTYYFSQRLFPIKFEVVKIAKMIILGIALFLISLFIIDVNFWLDLFLKLILIGAFPVLLYFLNFYEPIEIETMKNIASSLKVKLRRNR